VFVASLPACQAALATLSYYRAPLGNRSDARDDTVRVSVSDLGHTGSGGPQLGRFAVVVTPVNETDRAAAAAAVLAELAAKGGDGGFAPWGANESGLGEDAAGWAHLDVRDNRAWSWPLYPHCFSHAASLPPFF